MSRFYQQLTKALVEKDVEAVYRSEINRILPEATITSPYGSDGLIECGALRMLFEAKYRLRLKIRKESMGVIAQALFYLKKFKEHGEAFPNVLLIGDMNECFIVATNRLVKYFDETDIDWTKAPSSPHPKLLYKLLEDTDLAPYVYDVTDNLKLEDVILHAQKIAEGQDYKVKATQENIETLYQRWEDEIFNDKKLTSKDKVSIFLQALFYPEEVYLHPKKRNLLMLDKTNEAIRVKDTEYQAFFSVFHQGYSPSEIECFYSKKDRLIEDFERHFTGQFYTPSWVNKVSQDMISEVVGENWREEYLVIDPACGTGNLTRDYKFNDLILSTLEQRDVDIIKDQKYNEGAIVERWDFLNEDIPDSIRRKLEAADKVIWYMNPPFGTAANQSIIVGNHKATIANTKINKECKKEGLGRASSQLYTQFFYRVSKIMEKYKLKGYMFSYSAPTFITGTSFRKFREWWLARWKFKDGLLFDAAEFSTNVSSWGLSMTGWIKG